MADRILTEGEREHFAYVYRYCQHVVGRKRAALKRREDGGAALDGKWSELMGMVELAGRINDRARTK